MKRPYYALNGNEIIDVILSEVRKSLEASGKFGIAKTFPQVSWNWRLEMDVYPSEPSKFEVSATGGKKTGETTLEPLSVALEGGKDGVGVKIAPDQVRSDEGLQLMQPVQKKGGIVDELMDSLK